MRKHIQVTQVGPLSTLGGYAQVGELFLTARITGSEAEQIKELLRQLGAEIFIARMRRWAASPAGTEPPARMDPLRTDQVWRYALGSRGRRHLARRMGYALVRDGEVICELSPTNPGLAVTAAGGLPEALKVARPATRHGARAGNSSKTGKLAEVV